MPAVSRTWGGEVAQQGPPVMDRSLPVQAQRIDEGVLHGVLGVTGVTEDAPGCLERHRAVLTDDRRPVGQALLVIGYRCPRRPSILWKIVVPGRPKLPAILLCLELRRRTNTWRAGFQGKYPA